MGARTVAKTPRTKRGVLESLGAIGKPFSSLTRDAQTTARSIDRNSHKVAKQSAAKRRNPLKYKVL